MKLAFIVPSDYIQEFGSQGDFTLALAHLINLKDKTRYEKAITTVGLPIVLDNGLFENHEPEPVESLMLKALKINADLFFAPDHLYKREETMQALKDTIQKRNDLRFDCKIGAVVQADNVEDYIGQLLEFNNMSEVELIGLSILSIPKSFNLPIVESRIRLMERMIELQKEGVVWKNMHLLGLGDSYKDVMFAAEHCPWIISNDTSCCFQSGIFYKKLTDELEVPGGKIERKVDFDQQLMFDEQRENVEYNINKVKKVIK